MPAAYRNRWSGRHCFSRRKIIYTASWHDNIMGRRVNWGGVFFKKSPEHHKMLAVAFFLAALAALGAFTAPSPPDPLCASYVDVSGISCRDAVAAAVAKYPGTPLSISPWDAFSVPKMGTMDIWDISISLNQPPAKPKLKDYKNARIIMSRKDGQIVGIGEVAV